MIVVRRDCIVCEECDALYRRPALSSGQQLRCLRCGCLLGRGHRLDLEALLALTLTALVVFIVANTQPMVLVNLGGLGNAASLPGALQQTWAAGEPLIALLAGAVGFVFPLGMIVLRLYVMAPVATGRVPPGWRGAMRALRFATRWSMVEVLMLSALVAIVRVAGLATVQPGIGIFAFGMLALLLAGLQAAGEHRLWQLVERLC
jgi:paraquat-inducible protein A